jgi:hypothetical protein
MVQVPLERQHYLFGLVLDQNILAWYPAVRGWFINILQPVEYNWNLGRALNLIVS